MGLAIWMFGGLLQQVVLVTPDEGWLIDTDISPKIVNNSISGGCSILFKRDFSDVLQVSGYILIATHIQEVTKLVFVRLMFGLRKKERRNVEKNQQMEKLILFRNKHLFRLMLN
jgi:hypothetical protein